MAYYIRVQAYVTRGYRKPCRKARREDLSELTVMQLKSSQRKRLRCHKKSLIPPMH